MLQGPGKASTGPSSPVCPTPGSSTGRTPRSGGKIQPITITPCTDVSERRPT